MKKNLKKTMLRKLNLDDIKINKLSKRNERKK